jgi:preprotein translocase subunit YajC
MPVNFIDIAYAMGPGQPGGGAGQGGAAGMLGSVLPLVLIFVVFYFLLIRPQQKKAKEHKNMLDNLKKGDKIITSGGIFGIIEAVGTNTVTVKAGENVKIKIGKAYIASLRASSDED